jgi:adenine-specific DNA methylase
VATFTERLSSVLKEAHRVLKDEGLFVFSYHHSRQDGWRAVLQALMQSGFRITASQPIKSEMSIAMPKQQAKEPIDLDIIIVCRKRGLLKPHTWNGDLWTTVAPLAQAQIVRFRLAGRQLSRNDLRIILMGQLLRQLSLSATSELAIALLDSNEAETEQWIDRLNVENERTHR